MSHKYQKTVLIVGNAPPAREPSDIDIAWLAGLFEGEGSVTGKNGKKAVVSIPQKDAEILFRCREMLGGSISKVIREDTHLHVFSLCGDGGRRFLQAIYPFMSTRRKMQIEKAGGLAFTGRKQWGVKTTEERRALRLSMTESQKQVESATSYKDRNRESDRAYQREYRKRNLSKVRKHYSDYVNENRDHVNALQRVAYAKRKAAQNLPQNKQVLISEVIQ